MVRANAIINSTIGERLSAAGGMAESFGAVNPLRYRGYVYDREPQLYYLQSRYYDPELGRFINADAYASTGQGILGNNMFAYCGNNPIACTDFSGYRYSNACSMSSLDSSGKFCVNYIIYYFHPDSDKNLDGNALQNHSEISSIFVGVGSFEELINAFNKTPSYVDNVYIYLHSDENKLFFLDSPSASAEEIEGSFEAVDIHENVYLFACCAGRGEIASAMAKASNCTVIASVYKVSFGKGYARCGVKSYLFERTVQGDYSWYAFDPEGGRTAFSLIWISTQ